MTLYTVRVTTDRDAGTVNADQMADWQERLKYFNFLIGHEKGYVTFQITVSSDAMATAVTTGIGIILAWVDAVEILRVAAWRHE